VTERWKQLCPIFGILTEKKSNDELLNELIQSIKDFISSVDGPTCVNEIKDPLISKEDYFGKIDKLVDYAINDAVTLSTFRPINEELYRKIFEYAWDGKIVDF
jgi:alcohol dehydrogenase class IV